jgi:hypothetical protein
MMPPILGSMPRGRVLDGGPSDHRPFIRDLWVIMLGAWVRVVTFNLAKHNAIELANVIGSIHRLRPSIWLLQEVKRHGHGQRDPVKLLRSLGYRVIYVRPEFAIAIDRELWSFRRHWRALMSPVEYWTINYALVSVLEHADTGLLVKAVSAHPPAHVQAPKHPSWSKVWRVLHDWAEKARRLARRGWGRVDAVIMGLDLNVDTDTGWSPPAGWGFIDEGALELINPPKPTRGGRGIDVLMTRGIDTDKERRIEP